jgi:hypothetical protein
MHLTPIDVRHRITACSCQCNHRTWLQLSCFHLLTFTIHQACQRSAFTCSKTNADGLKSGSGTKCHPRCLRGLAWLVGRLTPCACARAYFARVGGDVRHTFSQGPGSSDYASKKRPGCFTHSLSHSNCKSVTIHFHIQRCNNQYIPTLSQGQAC